jgi:CheY-like chemotaxis protein
MDGVETTNRLRDSGYKKPIVALTANAVSGQADMFLENGFDDFISKPIDLRQMNVVLNKFVRDKQSPEVIEAARQEALEEKSSVKTTPTANTISLSKQKIAGLDIIQGLEKYDDNEKVYLDILRSYLRSTRSALGLIETVTEEGIDDYKITVHGIKGSSYNIFADEVGKEAEILEHAAGDGNLGLIHERNPSLLASTGKLLDNIEGMLSAVDGQASKPKKDKPDNESLAKLLTACTVYDIENVNAAMTEIEEYQYTGDDGLVSWLREKVDILECLQITEKLSVYLEE